MNEGKRPGGLTALAVINFVLSGWGFIGLLVLATDVNAKDGKGRTPLSLTQEEGFAEIVELVKTSAK